MEANPALEGVLFDLPNIVPHAVAAAEATRVPEALSENHRPYRGGTEGSNPSLSSGESRANLNCASRRHSCHRTEHDE
jgi:hypothetical protein